MSRAGALLAAAALLSAAALRAQERPLTISGTLWSGFYRSFTAGGGNENLGIAFVPAGGKCDLNGYYVSPDLVAYWIQPELNASPQASDAGFLGGNGVRMRITMLRRRALPVTFRFSNVQFEDVYFGSLSQISSYARTNRNRELGLTTEVRRGRWPTATIDWGTSSVLSESGIEQIPDYDSHSRHLNVDSRYAKFGWNLEGFAHGQQVRSGLIAPDAGDAGRASLRQTVLQYRVSAGRRFLTDSELYADAGSQSTSSLVADTPIDLTTRHASVNLRLMQRRRWKTSLRAGYSSNIASLFLSRFVDGLGAKGSLAPDPSVLLPFQHTVSYLNLNALTSLELSQGLGAYGSVDRTAVVAASAGSLNSQYVTSAGGLTFAKTFGWGSVSGQYGGTLGSGSVTGQTGRIEGTNYAVSAQHGKRSGLLIDVSVRGSSQNVRSEQSASEHSFASDGNVELPLFGQLRARVGGGRHRGTFSNAGNDYRTAGYTAQAGIDHPRFQLGGSLNSSAGNSLQLFGSLPGEIGLGSTILTPLRLARSDFRGLTLSAHANPMRRMELTALWTRSTQHLEGVVANDFDILDVRLTLFYRRLQFVAGVFESSQLYSSYLATYPETQRGRYYFRITRTLKLQ